MSGITTNLKPFFTAFALVAIALTGAGNAYAQQVEGEKFEEERRAKLVEIAATDKYQEVRKTEAASKKNEEYAGKIAKRGQQTQRHNYLIER